VCSKFSCLTLCVRDSLEEKLHTDQIFKHYVAMKMLKAKGVDQRDQILKAQKSKMQSNKKRIQIHCTFSSIENSN